MSKPYIEFSYSYLYTSDIPISIKWFQRVLGFQVLEATPQYAVMETSPGQILYLSSEEDSTRSFVFLASEENIQLLRKDLIENKIAIQEDFPHWLVFQDPDQNTIGVWAAKANLRVDYQIPDKVVQETIRFYLESKEELHFVIRSIEEPSEYEAASDAFLKECRKMGIVSQGDAIRVTRFSNHIDATYMGLPLLGKPSKELPDLSEYIVIPAQEYTVYPIPKSLLAGGRSNELVNRVRHSSTALGRPKQFYILEQDIDKDYVEAFIPYVWSSAQ